MVDAAFPMQFAAGLAPSMRKKKVIKKAFDILDKDHSGELGLDEFIVACKSNDLEKVTSLNLNGNKLTEVPRGLERLTQLKSLYLTANQLTDVKGLEKLTQLESLHLARNQLTDVKGLDKLTRLKSLGQTRPPPSRLQLPQRVFPPGAIRSEPDPPSNCQRERRIHGLFQSPCCLLF